jgi:hypothetical protein
LLCQRVRDPKFLEVPMARLVVIGLVLIGFSALTVEVIAQYGYLGYFVELLSRPASIHVSADVVIALGLAVIWMWSDASERALPFWPYAVVTLFLGSVGLLGYLGHRELRGLRAGSARRAVA